MVTLPQGTLLEGYTILRVLGEGGFGITYLADDTSLQRHFAIKEYFPQSWASRESGNSVSVSVNSASGKDYSWGLARFLDEARTLAKFRHPAIVQVTRVFEANNTAYMVLEYEDGQDFGKWLKVLGRPPAQEELDGILRPILSALTLIHSNGILHRDIAPDNIYIRSDGTPVLLDFGSARQAIGNRTKTMSAVVKSGYSPMEQYTAKGKDQGAWTDIYALGATLYKAVTGASPQEATERAIEDGYVSVSKGAKGEYRASFLAAIDDALRLRHKDRPQAVEAWEKKLLGEAAAPVPESRKKSGAGLKWAAAALIALMIGGGGYYFGVVVPEQEERAAIARAEAEKARKRQEAEKARKEKQAKKPVTSDDLIPKKKPGGGLKNFGFEKFAWDLREDSIPWYEKYLKDNPFSKHRKEAEKRLAELRAAKAEYERGLKLFKDDKYDGAIKAFTDAITGDPRYAEAYKERGLAYAVKKEFGKAVDDYDKAISFGLKDADTHNLRGIALYGEKKYADALKDFETATGLDKTKPAYFFNRGAAQEKLGAKDKAIADYREAQKIQPGHKNSLSALKRLGQTVSASRDGGGAVRQQDRPVTRGFDPKNLELFTDYFPDKKPGEICITDASGKRVCNPSNAAGKADGESDSNANEPASFFPRNAPPLGQGGLARLLIDEDAAWKKAQEVDTISAYTAYRRAHPKGKHLREATQRIIRLRLKNAARRRDQR